MAFVDPDQAMAPPVQPIQQHVSDANNPAAQAFAVSRLHQLVRAHLLGAMPQNMGDAAQVWRGLSATLQQNPQALQAFLAANRPAPVQHRVVDPRYGIPDKPFPGINTPAPGPSINPQTGTPQAGSQYPEQLPFHPPTPSAVAAVLAVLQHIGGTPYNGRH